MSDLKKKILYVDDEEFNLVAFKATFRMEYQVLTAISAAEARKIIENEKDLVIVISDQRMPDETGVQLFESMVDKYPEIIRILLTGFTDIDAVIAAINHGHIYRYLQKPWNEGELRKTLEHCSEVFRLRQENIELTRELARVNKQLEFLYRQTLLS
ncbi:MAG: response regulator [Bacteroidia bacterium]